MALRTLFRGASVHVAEWICPYGPADRPFAEVYDAWRISYVRRGSFGCRAHGREFEFVAGSLKVGCPGDEYVAMHEHHHGCGDECLTIAFSAEAAEAVGAPEAAWRRTMSRNDFRCGHSGRPAMGRRSIRRR